MKKKNDYYYKKFIINNNFMNIIIFSNYIFIKNNKYLKLFNFYIF